MCKNEAVTWRITSSSCLCVSVLFGVLAASSLLEPAAATPRDAIIQAFTERFTRTTGEEFYELWHSDCHRRCRSQLIGHVTLACTFDPYKLSRRSLTKRDINNTIAHIIQDTERHDGMGAPGPPDSHGLLSQHELPFLPKTDATTFLQRHSRGKFSRPTLRRKKRGIMDECCYSKSCSWEEYAEFCHTYNRKPAARDTVCFP